MNLLGIDTASFSGGIALINEERLIAEHRLHIEVRHAERVMGAIDQVLKQGKITVSDLEAIVVSIGPGSFTGLRVGLATAKGLAMGAGLPLVLVPTLEVLAAAFPYAKPLIVPFVDARQSHVYWALFDYSHGQLRRCHPDAASEPVSALETIVSSKDWAERDLLFVGDGAIKYRETITAKVGARTCFTGKVYQYPSAAHLAELGMARYLNGNRTPPELANPVYIRDSAAELKRSEALVKNKER